MTPEQLRASILQYAAEGKLVKQNPNDEPASELIKRIESERDELIKEGKIKKSKKLPAVTDDEKLFDIPDNWKWVRLGDIYNFIDYRGKTPHKISSGIRLITAKNVRNGYIKLDPEEFISAEEYKECSTRGFIHKNDIFITTEAPMGLVAVNDFNEPIATAQRLITLQKYFEKQNNNFFAFQMQSPFFQEELRQSSTGTTVKGIKASNLKQILVLLPPLEEQKRIVAKIEKLMPLVDEYAESYNRLQKIDNEFEDKLKQSVLQYAMEGKLVKQNPSDEPASELIKKIENEKAELIKEGKIKKSKKLPAITDDEKPFDIPDSWEWVRLKQITTYGNFNSIKGSSIPDNSWVVDMKDVRKNGGGFSEIVRRKSTDIYKSNKYSFNKNAVLYGKLRPYLRKVEIAQTSGFTTTEMLPINVVDLSTLVPQYLRYAMLSPYFVNLVNDSMYGMKMPRVGTTFLAKMVVPLPPLEEQKRIVEKVEELQSSISNLSK
ncbi:restriction endonuclease subunit S [Lactobacillus amylovorus]|uniref:restriction endonuclease subunit S n=1 Tax=Lactobacillus amylovorus TaxID=1604 RepID=UPI003F96DB34